MGCYSIGSCMWSAEEQVDTSGLVMVTASESAHGQRRLRETPTHADLSAQLAIKHGMAASYSNVEPFEVAITKNEVRGQDMKLAYKILVVGTANRSTITADEVVKVANEELDEQSSNMTFASAKMEAGTTQHQTRVFSFEKQPAATSSTESSITWSGNTASGTCTANAPKEGECFGYDSRCRVDTKWKCRSAAKKGADCV